MPTRVRGSRRVVDASLWRAGDTQASVLWCLRLLRAVNIYSTLRNARCIPSEISSGLPKAELRSLFLRIAIAFLVVFSGKSISIYLPRASLSGPACLKTLGQLTMNTMGNAPRTAMRQKRVSLPAPMLTTWHLVPSCRARESHALTSPSTASERTYVPTLMRGGRGGWRCARDTKGAM